MDVFENYSILAEKQRKKSTKLNSLRNFNQQDLCRVKEYISELLNISCMKSQIEEHRRYQLGIMTNLIRFDLIQAVLTALPSCWNLCRSVQVFMQTIFVIPDACSFTLRRFSGKGLHFHLKPSQCTVPLLQPKMCTSVSVCMVGRPYGYSRPADRPIENNSICWMTATAIGVKYVHLWLKIPCCSQRCACLILFALHQSLREMILQLAFCK